MNRNWLNYAGKENGLSDYFFKNYIPTDEYDKTKLFVKHIDNESIEELTCRIYNILESWFLHNRAIPEMIVLTRQDYMNLLENSNIINDDYIFGMKIDFFRKKVVNRRGYKKYGIKSKSI